MRRFRACSIVVLLAVAATSFFACGRLPKGEWRIEMGRARLVDDLGESRTRLEAVVEAEEDARVKLLRYIEELPTTSNYLVGDLMTQKPRIGQLVRDLIVSARRVDARYGDEVVEVDMAVNIEDVRRVLLGAKMR